VNEQTVKAMLRKADPQSNSSMHERKSALQMAEREMDKNGWSFASLGFSMDEAERIANQFSVTAPRSTAPREKVSSLGIFRGQRSEAIKPARRDTVYSQPAPKKKEPKPVEHQETYTEQCERLDYEERTRKYEAWEAHRREEKALEEEASKIAVILQYVFLGIVIVVVGIVAYSLGLDTFDELTTLLGQIIAGAILLGIAYLIYRFVRGFVGLFR